MRMLTHDIHGHLVTNLHPPNATCDYLQWLLAQRVPLHMHHTVTVLPLATMALPRGLGQRGHKVVLVCVWDE